MREEDGVDQNVVITNRVWSRTGWGWGSWAMTMGSGQHVSAAPGLDPVGNVVRAPAGATFGRPRT